MDQLAAGRRFVALVVIAVLALTKLCAMAAAEFGIREAMAEGAFVENLQAVLLMAAAALFFFAAFRFRDAPRMAAVLLGVLCLLFFFREVDLRVGPSGRDILGSAAFRWAEVAALVLGLGPYLWRRRELFAPLVRYVLSLEAWPFFVAGGFLVLGDVAEQLQKAGLDRHTGIFFEEMFELQGFAILLLAAILFAVRSRRMG